MNELEKELDKQILEFGEFSEDSLDIEEKKLDLKELMNYSLFEPTEGWKVDHFNEEQKTTNLDVFNNKTIFSDYFLNQGTNFFHLSFIEVFFFLFGDAFSVLLLKENFQKRNKFTNSGNKKKQIFYMNYFAREKPYKTKKQKNKLQN
ncbi:hypothetical protein M0813_01138 [Anaeramoeba flamelloides]|uniref:Uncharacterized protein n=1 Tax=Anaeramoeba flamelloides TaxID=1746091 RepID=A0AAV7Z630_9EUKA|nr:hypothetical protein M0812_18509 [Anaeramoeba flamelloides]KAJ6226169.1 hypothetical protein M0813_01138 [Anaeramoeba flamelloides]